jgi:NAD-dependent SIR2 family protein deacetylase
MSKDFELARQWLVQADSVLLASGAGLSAAAGIDYTDPQWFAQHFTPMLQYGVKTCGEILGGMGLPPLLQWGYLSHQLQLVRFSKMDHPVYHLQYEQLKNRDYFVMTSNVDALYERHGFDPERIYTPQGDYARLQCTGPCTEATWSTQEHIERIRAATDPDTYELQDNSLLPTCPNCGRPLFMNVRAAHWFLEAPYRGQAKRLHQWLSGLDERNLLIIEIGAGFNTPSVIRWPMEQLTARRPNTRFIRVNTNEHQVPDNIVDRTLTFACDANHFVNQCFSE